MAEKQTASVTPNKTNAILAWVFAPLTSFIFMNDEDAFTKKCAKHSLYFGVGMIIVHIALWVIGTVLTFILIGPLCFLLDSVVWLVDIAIRIMGAVKANNGELFEVPVTSGMVKE
ncbi:DUF4870 domain-containing protein [Patescibacteria group bacterium]